MNGGEQPRSLLVQMTRHIQAASCVKRTYCGGNAHEKTKTDFCGCCTLWRPHSDRRDCHADRSSPGRHGCTGRASALGLRSLSVLVATQLLRWLRRLCVLPTPSLLASPSLLVMFRGGANTPPLSFWTAANASAHQRRDFQILPPVGREKVFFSAGRLFGPPAAPAPSLFEAWRAYSHAARIARRTVAESDWSEARRRAHKV